MKTAWRILAVAALVLPVRAEMRTWTSASGAQMEAEFVQMQGDHAVLRAADGREFKIQLSGLSEPDQAFIQDAQAPAEPPPEEEPAAGEPRSHQDRDDRPRAPKREPGEWDRITGPDVMAAPDAVGADFFTKLAEENLNRSIFIGLQYGPQKTDVLYCAFEVEDPTRPPETLHVYGPGLDPKLQNRTLKATRRTIDKQRVSRFRDIQVESAFGDVRFSADIEFHCGLARSDTVLLVANSKLERDRTASVFTIGGFLNDDAQYGTGSIKVIPLLAEPRAAVVAKFFGAPVVYGSCAMNRLSIIPKSGMETALKASLVDAETGQSVGTASVNIEEYRLLNGKPDKTINHRFENAPQGRRYEAEVAIDLGPFLGPVKQRIRFR